MTPHFRGKNSTVTSALLPLCGVLAVGFTACDGATPHVSGRNLVIPDRSPSRAVQALDAPSSDGSSSGSNAEAFCLNGAQGSATQEPDGTFSSEWICQAGGGIASIENAGVSDPDTGDGAYDQVTTFEDGSSTTWHFTFDTADDFLSTTYSGVSDDGGESYVGTYTYNAADPTRTQMHEVWNLREGTYVTDGLISQDGLEFDGTQSFDDPDTDAAPDWSADTVTHADGSFSQIVHFVGDGFVSDYSYAVSSDGSVDYGFDSDLTTTAANPDYAGSYAYAADGSGEGGYTQSFDDGSTNAVHDVIAADGSVRETWSFDDVATAQSVDQEGDMHWNLDGSGDGSVTTHIVGGGVQVCDIHIGADGSQTVDNCR